MKMYGGGGSEEEEKKKKKKRKVKRGDASSAVKIIDHDEGLGGIALATAKGAQRMSDEELSDEQAVIVEEEELRKAREEADKISSVQAAGIGYGVESVQFGPRAETKWLGRSTYWKPNHFQIPIVRY